MYDYEKTKYGKKQDCYMDTDCFIVFIRTDDISNDIAEDIEIRFDTSNYELDRPLPKRWIRWENHERICGIKNKNLQLRNRWQ